jgi:hypothetical protein
MSNFLPLYDCDGLPLLAGYILEPFDWQEPEGQFLHAAPLWRVEPDEVGGWRTQPQAGGTFHVLTQALSERCRVWPNPVTDICDPSGQRFPPDTPPAKRFHAV